MKKIISSFLIGSTLFLGSNSLKANEYNAFGVVNNDGLVTVYGINTEDGTKTSLSTKNFGTNVGTITANSFLNSGTGELMIKSGAGKYEIYNWSKNEWREINVDEMNGGVYEMPASFAIDSSNSEFHLGENSLVTKEENGMQNLWGQDANGKKIPINITNGSKLLINGRDVEQSINNVGALSAALTGLPTVPSDTTLACGLGTGTHGGDFAFSGGCASKVNDQLSINYAASMTMPSQDYAGNFEDKFSARAGFVWKLGKSIKPNLISMKEKETMEVKIDSLEDKNKKLEDTVSTLIAKLERLEKIALSETKTKDLATIKLP